MNVPFVPKEVEKLDPALKGVLAIFKITRVADHKDSTCVYLEYGVIHDLAAEALKAFAVMVHNPTHFNYVIASAYPADLLERMRRDLNPII
jgi:hypothetical protein